MIVFKSNDFQCETGCATKNKKEIVMMLSKESVETLNDLIENRLSIMTINDQDDLREQIKLKRALLELQNDTIIHDGGLSALTAIPRRGRRRKVGGAIGTH
jgi:hypothetical protein